MDLCPLDTDQRSPFQAPNIYVYNGWYLAVQKTFDGVIFEWNGCSKQAACNPAKRKTLQRIFALEVSESFHNTFLTGHLWMLHSE